jgi:hypothetical protein
VPQRANLPVKMKRERGQLVIVSIDASRLYDAATPDDDVNPYGVAKHTHMIGTGLDYEVEAERLEPGRVYPAGGLVAGVRTFRYYYNGAWETFEGDTISLGTYRPTTVGHHAWVLVGVNPATNGIVAVAGTSQIYATALTIAQIDSIAFLGYIPCGAVKVRNDDTAITDIAKYQDARNWLEPPYVPMAQATVKGRAAGAGTGAPVDLTAAQQVAILQTDTAFNEAVQDAVGSILVDTDTIDLTYTDATPSITADLKHVGAHVTHDTNQSVNNTTFTVLAFATERWDTNTFHDTVTNNSRLTIPTGKTGKYIVSAGIEWAVSSVGERFIGIRKNGTTFLRIVTQTPTTVSDMRMMVSAIVSLAATDYIEVLVWQNTGGALNVVASGDYSPEFELAFVGV